MDRADADGAMAAATYFLALYSYARTTGDLTSWTAISDASCVFCRSVQDSVQAAFGNGYHSEGGLVTIVGAAMAVAGSYPATYHVSASVHQASIRVVNRAGEVVEEHPAQSGHMLIAVATKLADGWRITGVNTERDQS
jgi:hypothetical protein